MVFYQVNSAVGQFRQWRNALNVSDSMFRSVCLLFSRISKYNNWNPSISEDMFELRPVQNKNLEIHKQTDRQPGISVMLHGCV